MNIREHHRMPSRQREGGTAAVEMALLSFVMAMILLAPIMIARSLMQVSLAQRAAFNAVHMIATYPAYLRLQTGSTPVQEASDMAIEALIDGGIPSGAIGSITPYCPGSSACSGKVQPSQIAIDLYVDVLNPLSVLPTFATVTVPISAADRYAN